jgi:transcription factor C subunit 7
MPVQEILLLRHGHRLAWSFDPKTQSYISTHPFPTGLPADPPLASHGVRQSHETAAHLSKLLLPRIQEDRLRIYSSLFYRCLETLRPSIEAFRALGWKDKVRGERGVGEWFGAAPFEQPEPGDWKFLSNRFFPWLEERESKVVPGRCGESIALLHDRLAGALEMIVMEVDREYEESGRGMEDVTVLICGHAAGIIAGGRALTGKMPEDSGEEDFKCFTCGLSRFVRREKGTTHSSDSELTEEAQDWSKNGGVVGGWDCLLNSSCGHLSQGEERGWHFVGEETFDSYGPPRTCDGQNGDTEKIEDTNEEKADGSKL